MLLSHHERITVRSVKGKPRDPGSASEEKNDVQRQMYTENGSSLSMDKQLCVPADLSPFPPLSGLRCRLDGILGISSLSSSWCDMDWTQSTKRTCPGSANVSFWLAFGLPAFQYLGPTMRQMTFLLVFLLVNSFTLFALVVLLVRNIWCLGANVTTIEGWEIERHEALVHRARKLGGYINGPDGMKIWLQKQEFPYDIGIYQNIVQGMGSNPLIWLWPFASTPENESGLSFETNGLEGSVQSIYLW